MTSPESAGEIDWKAKYLELKRSLEAELRDPNGTIWEHAERLQAQVAQKDGEIANLRIDLGKATSIAKSFVPYEQLAHKTELVGKLGEALKPFANHYIGYLHSESSGAYEDWEEVELYPVQIEHIRKAKAALNLLGEEDSND